MVDWEPISEAELLARISQGCARMTEAQQRLWTAIRIDPEKWQQHPYGDGGGGFWTVALVGRTAIWYNDLENGFNRLRFQPVNATHYSLSNQRSVADEAKTSDLLHGEPEGADVGALAEG